MFFQNNSLKNSKIKTPKKKRKKACKTWVIGKFVNFLPMSNFSGKYGSKIHTKPQSQLDGVDGT